MFYFACIRLYACDAKKPESLNQSLNTARTACRHGRARILCSGRGHPSRPRLVFVTLHNRIAWLLEYKLRSVGTHTSGERSVHKCGPIAMSTRGVCRQTRSTCTASPSRTALPAPRGGASSCLAIVQFCGHSFELAISSLASKIVYLKLPAV